MESSCEFGIELRVPLNAGKVSSGLSSSAQP
jgi:hypothetical protein